MSAQITPEDAAELVLYLDEDPSLPASLLSIVQKLKSLALQSSVVDSAFGLNTVWSFRFSFYECIIHCFLEPWHSCWAFHGVAHAHIFNCPGISGQMAVFQASG
jgi:hypothetical protein